MITTKFEDLYSCVLTAKADTEKLAAVVDFLSKQTEPLTCKEIGVAIFGEVYANSYKSRSYSAQMGQILKHLRQGGFIAVEERIGEPMTIEVMDWIAQDSAGVPLTITVHDDEGNTYQMPNPKANQRDCRHGYWGPVKKTVIPKTKVYKWVA
jgi:hypothetical protein